MSTLSPASEPPATAIDAAMHRAFELAVAGPIAGGNPQVGCVLLAPDGTTIAEGWHHGAGTAHAEVDALDHAPAGAVRGSSAVVSLEPCNHTGRTGPCSHALADAGVANVYYAVADPGTISGGGGEWLAAHGVAVHDGVLADEGERLLHPWLTATRRGWPWVTAKIATTIDGRAAAADRTSKWITGPESLAHAHRERGNNDAIVVGAGTVLDDDPRLTARDEAGRALPHQPIPVVLAHPAGLPRAASALEREHGGRVITADLDIRGLRSASADVVRDRLGVLLRELFGRQDGIRRMLVEGGPTVTTLFVRAGLVDEYHWYLAPMLTGGPLVGLGDIGVGTLAHARHLSIVETARLGNDVFLRLSPLPAEQTE